MFWRKRADVKVRRQRCAGDKKEWPLGATLLGFWSATEKSIEVDIIRKEFDGSWFWFACLSP